MYRFSFIYTFPIENLHDPVTWLCRRPGNSCRFQLNRLFSKTGSEMLAQPSNTVKRFLVVLTFNQAVRFSLDGSAVKIHVQAVRAAADTDSADDQGTLTALINAATRQPRCQSIGVGLPKQCVAVYVKQPCGGLLSQRIQKDCFGEGGGVRAIASALYIFIFNIFDSFGNFETP